MENLASKRFFEPRKLSMVISALCIFGFGGCQTTEQTEPPKANVTYTGNSEFNIFPKGTVSGGVGIEAQDVNELSRRIVKDLVKNADIFKGEKPKIIIDSKYIRNDGLNILNPAIFTDKLRFGLVRAARGKITFVGRQDVRMVTKERALRDSGTLEALSKEKANRKILGGDYRLTGRLATMQGTSPRTGMVRRYSQITFELIDLVTSEIVWTFVGGIEKEGADDVIYR